MAHTACHETDIAGMRHMLAKLFRLPAQLQAPHSHHDEISKILNEMEAWQLEDIGYPKQCAL